MELLRVPAPSPLCFVCVHVLEGLIFEEQLVVVAKRAIRTLL